MKIKNKIKTVDLYRFQLFPVSSRQIDLFDELLNQEDIIKRKNEIFDKFLNENRPLFSNQGKRLPYKTFLKDGDLRIIELGVEKLIEIKSEDLESTEVESFPSHLIAINNNDNNQSIGITRNYKGFSSTSAIANALMSNYNPQLQRYGLRVDIKPILDEYKLWVLIKRYQNSIVKISFDIAGVNMARITNTLSKDMKLLIQSTSSANTKIELEAVKGEVLENLNEDNPQFNDIVKLNQEGVAGTKIKVKGAKKYIKTKNTIKSVVLSEVEFSSNNAEAVAQFKGILDL